MNAGARRLVLGLLGLAGFFVLWEVASAMEWVHSFLASRPSQVVASFGTLLLKGEIAEHFLASLTEFGAGYAAATVIAIPFGLTIGWNPTLNRTFEPYIWFLYSAPLVAFYPLFLVWFGLGKPTVIVICFLMAFFPICVNAAEGMRTVDASLVRAARAFGASQGDIVRKVALPHSLPMVLSGMRMALGRSLVGVIVGEFFGADKGLGFAVRYYGGFLQPTEVFVYLMVIAGTGVVLNQSMQAYERWAIRR